MEILQMKNYKKKQKYQCNKVKELLIRVKVKSLKPYPYKISKMKKQDNKQFYKIY